MLGIREGGAWRALYLSNDGAGGCDVGVWRKVTHCASVDFLEVSGMDNLIKSIQVQWVVAQIRSDETLLHSIDRH